MTGARKFTSPDGSTAIVFDTPCGFTITLAANADGVRVDSRFGGSPVSIANSNYRLSREGAAMLSVQIKDLLDARP